MVVGQAVDSINDDRTECCFSDYQTIDSINDVHIAHLYSDEQIHATLALINTEEEVNHQRSIHTIGTCDTDLDFVRIEGSYQYTSGGYRVTDQELALGKLIKEETDVDMI
ncbi:hypothetical protein L211DRAFT_854401 [Terfezia boudieri ATCC MYA-4762]|uniref:Uncharacterized protein n=1 Tax=Terfezia boudieri ATCC MYA-4762 TaxID=1051890 RepID=A0A3N4L5G8_9PEZI|nr:hypothetical protein L211DRAFT_854401 [Terfezia boudieri ATCC MYA-4762]